MTTSGQYDYSPNCLKIIKRAFRVMGVTAEGETPDANMQADALEALDTMVKEWAATGIHVWTQAEAILFLQPNQTRYIIGSATTTDHATDAFDYAATTLSANAAAAATSIQVSSISGIASGDKIGIVLDSGSLQWTMVSGAPSGSTVNLSAALTGSVSSGNAIYAYTTDLVRPLKIPQDGARRYTFQGQLDTPLLVISHLDYQALPNKTSTGLVNQIMYQPMLGYGQLFTWPAPPDVTNAVRFTYYKPLQIFVANGDTADFPDEWVAALSFGLACELAPEYNMPPEQLQALAIQTQAKTQRLMIFDRENEAIQFGFTYDYGA